MAFFHLKNMLLYLSVPVKRKTNQAKKSANATPKKKSTTGVSTNNVKREVAETATVCASDTDDDGPPTLAFYGPQ